VVLGALTDGVVAVEAGGVVAVALESEGVAEASGATDAAVLEVELVLELLPICVSRKEADHHDQEADDPIWTIGLSLMAFLMRSPGAAAESKKAPTRRRRPA